MGQSSLTARRHILVVFGTRPGAIKLAPLLVALQRAPGIKVTSCVTAQHRELLDGVLASVGVSPDIDLDLMLPDQQLGELTARVLGRMREVLQAERPSLVIVQGDTTTAMATALAAHYEHVPIAHIEAGLRTSTLDEPWPEEANRRVISRLAALHFAPTEHARHNLLREDVSAGTIHVVGNTGIDAAARTPVVDPSFAAGTVLLTCHRRENQRDEFRRATTMFRALAAAFPQRQFVFPVHPNPRVRGPIHSALGDVANVALVEPFDYPTMLGAIRTAQVVVTDSGGVQEEAAYLGTPCLVARRETDRPESVESGQAFVVGLDVDAALDAMAALEDEQVYARAAQPSHVFGDGHACERIIDALG